MANKFLAGMTYLGKKDGGWYIIQQKGQRSWEAVLFSHAGVHGKEGHMHGNASLRNEFEETHAFIGNNYLRRTMFNILKSGTIYDAEDEQ